MRHYTKNDLESIIYTQLENLNAVNDLLGIMKTQNALLYAANERLRAEIVGVKRKAYPKLKGKLIRKITLTKLNS